MQDYAKSISVKLCANNSVRYENITILGFIFSSAEWKMFQTVTRIDRFTTE